jgi:hypothetical protein
MTHPITPPPELVEQWRNDITSYEVDMIRASQWGADQELEACCESLQDPDLNIDTYKLRAARRPKPPSLKERALHELACVYNRDEIDDSAYDAIRRALEALPND